MFTNLPSTGLPYHGWFHENCTESEVILALRIRQTVLDTVRSREAGMRIIEGIPRDVPLYG